MTIDTKYSKMYWKILDNFLELHPYLQIDIFKHNNKIVISFSVRNKQILLGLGKDSSLSKAIQKASDKFNILAKETIKTPNYKLQTSKKNIITNIDDISKLILEEKCRIQIYAKINFLKEKEKIVKIITAKKENNILHTYEQKSSEKAEILALILKTAKKERIKKNM